MVILHHVTMSDVFYSMHKSPFLTRALTVKGVSHAQVHADGVGGA